MLPVIEVTKGFVICLPSPSSTTFCHTTPQNFKKRSGKDRGNVKTYGACPDGIKSNCWNFNCKITIWWCRLFSWEFTIKINNLEITDLHMLTHASLRTQENNFGSKYVKIFILQTSGHRKVMFKGGEFTRTYIYIKPQEKNVPWLFEGVWFFTWL